jgi:hypothetical protein
MRTSWANVAHERGLVMNHTTASSTDKVAARDASTGNWRLATVLTVGVLNVAILGIGIWSTFDSFPGGDIDLAGLALALAAIAMVTFLGFYNDSGDIRTAIAATFIFVYFATLAASLNNAVEDKLNAGFAKDMFTNLTTLVGVVVTFYITGKTVEATAEIVRNRDS